MASRIKSFLLVLVALLPLFACKEQETDTQNGPTYLKVSFSSDNLRADQSVITVTVSCDWEWKASLASKEWSGLTEVKQDGKTGTFNIVLLFNNTDDARSNTLVVTSGEKTVETSFKQMGLNDFFQPRQLALTGTEESSISFNAGADWVAAVQEGEDWISLKTTSGKAGQSVITCAAKSELYESEFRTGVIRLSHSNQYLDIPVVQGNTIINTHICGLYGIPELNCIHGEDGWSLLSRAILPDGTTVFRLLNAQIPAAAVVTGAPQTLKLEEQCQLHVKVMEKGDVSFVADYDVVLVYEKDGMRWLKDTNNDNVYFIIK